MHFHQQVAYKFIFLIILFAMLVYRYCVTNSYAQRQHITFDCLSLDQGLSQSTITSIIQDEEGYMWFGTIDGLNQFDGYNFKVYYNNPLDSNSIADNWITSLCLGKDSTIWIGTLSRGLSRFNHLTGKFNNYQFNPIPNDSPERQRILAQLPFTFSYLNYYTIKSICEDRSGSIWIGTFGAGLYEFDKNQKKFIHYPYNFEARNDLAYNIMSICESFEGNKNILWIGTYGGGLVKFEPNKGFSFYKHDANDPNSLSDDRIIAIYPDTCRNNNVIWIGTYAGGLVKFEPDKEKFTHFKHDPLNSNSLSSNFVMSILKDCCHELWVGTFDAGLNRLEISTNQFTHYHHYPTNSNSLGSNEVLSLFEDRSGIIWIGTNLGYGINKFNRRKNIFNHYFHDHANPNSLSENVVFSLFEDREGILWIGTFQRGLNKFDRLKNEFTNYVYDPQNSRSLSDNHIRTIFEDSYGKLWIGTFSGGLNYFDRTNNRFIHYKYEPLHPNSLSSNQVRSIYEDQSGNLWIAAFGGGLDKFNRDTKDFTHYRHDPNNPNSISDNQVYFITGDSSGFLWIATFGGGINQFDIQANKFTHYRHDPNNKNSLCDDRILTIYVDQKDESVIWIGSFGKGLNKFDTRNQIFTHYTVDNGLPNDVIYSMLADDEGNLWLSTNKGLSKFNPETATSINYDLLDGLQSNEFNAGAYYKSPRTGELFFGGVNGFNCFIPSKIEVNEIVPPVVITSFKVFDEETVDEIGPIFKGKEIELTHKENFFSFEFSVLDYIDGQKNRFAYKLEGLDVDWIDCGNRRYVNYTNLDPGDYIFKVRGANCDGVWNEQGTYVKLKIKPRFYQTWWWHPCVVGILILLIILFFTWRTRYKVKRSLELERVRNQEKERVQKTVAADFHDELGQKLTKISLFSEILKTKLSDSFPEKIEYINKINKAAKELSSSTRDFIWTLSPAQDSLYDIVIYLKDFGDELFDKTGIHFRVNNISKELDKVKLPMEWRRQLILIFKEAMNNVIKHAGCSNLMLKISLNCNLMELSLSDDGMGCLNGKNTKGQGLSNMKNRAESINGKLNIITKEGKGTTIQFLTEIPRMGY